MTHAVVQLFGGILEIYSYLNPNADSEAWDSMEGMVHNDKCQETRVLPPPCLVANLAGAASP